MIVDFSKIDLREPPVLILKNIDGTEIQTLGYALNVAPELHFNEISQITFDLPATVDGVKTPHYDDVVGMRLIDLVGVGQFKLVDPTESKDGVKTIKSCKAYSLEYEFVEKKIALEEDTYELTDGLDERDTILGIILEKLPSWRKGTVSPALVGKYRTFDTSSQSVYDFMKSTLQEKFRCVFDFDTYTRTVNVIDVDDFVPTRSVFLSMENLLKKVEVQENSDNIVTCLGVYGADGVDIYSVNPTGTDKIYNLDYLFQSGQIQEPAQSLGDTDDSFGAKWRRWEKAVQSSQDKFYSLSVEQAINTANSLAQKAVLLRLDGELTGLEALKATYVSAIAQGLEKDPASGQYFTSLLADVNAQIAAKEAEIAKAKQKQSLSDQYADAALAAMKELQKECSFASYFTDYVCPGCGGVAKKNADGKFVCQKCGAISDKAESELLVLNRYFREDTMEDESFVARTVKSYSENDRSGSVGNVSVQIVSSSITKVHAEDVHKDTYTVSSGSMILSSTVEAQSTIISAAKIRSAALVHNTQDDTFVMSLYLGAGTVGTDTFSGGNITLSGIWSALTGDLHTDSEVGDENYQVGTQMTLTASDGVWYFTTDTSKYEELSISHDLYEYGVECLRKMAFPTYTFSISSGNFLSLDNCILFHRQLAMGKRIYLDLDDGEVLEPICTGVSFSYENPDSLTLEFSDTYSGSDRAMNLAGLLEESVSMGKSVASSKNGWSAFIDSGASTTVKDFMDNALDVAKNKLLSSTMQAITFDESGIRLRKWKDASKTDYEDTQIWMTDQNIMLTDDGWQTAKMAIGKLVTEKYGETFGICAPLLVGAIMAGERLYITNRNGNFVIDEEGIKINGLNFFVSASNIREASQSAPDVSSLPVDAAEGDLCAVGDNVYQFTSGAWALYMKTVGTKEDLPSGGPGTGNENVLYKIAADKSVWQWADGAWQEYTVPISDYIKNSAADITGKDDDGNIFVKADKVAGILNAAKARMIACDSKMLMDGNGMWLIDTSSPTTATKAVWMNQSGIMLSKARTSYDSADPSYNGSRSFTWKTAITADGIVADYLVGSHLHGEFDISAGTPTSTGNYATCPFYVDSDGNLRATKAAIKGDIDADDIKIGGTSIKSKLQYLTDALTTSASGPSSGDYGLDLQLEGGGLVIDSASTASYATWLYSDGALRMTANSGSVWIANKHSSPTGSMQMMEDGTIKLDGTSLLWNGKALQGSSTTAVFG